MIRALLSGVPFRHSFRTSIRSIQSVVQYGMDGNKDCLKWLDDSHSGHYTSPSSGSCHYSTYYNMNDNFLLVINPNDIEDRLGSDHIKEK